MKLTFFSVIFVLVVFGCSCKTDQSSHIAEGRAIEQNNVLSTLDALYFHYLNGDIEQARSSLLESISILDKATCFEDVTRAGLMRLEYSRLAVLESKVGDKLTCEAFLLSANYWQLRVFELSNTSARVAMSMVKAFDINMETGIVENMDKSLHAGELANYNKATKETTVSKQ